MDGRPRLRLYRQTGVQLWMRDRLVEAIDIVPFGYADTLRGQAEAEENEAFE